MPVLRDKFSVKRISGWVADRPIFPPYVQKKEIGKKCDSCFVTTHEWSANAGSPSCDLEDAHRCPSWSWL